MLIFVVYVLVISNWHANVNSNWNAQYMLFVIAEYLFKLGTRARTFLLVLVWHTFVQPLGRVRARAKESCIQTLHARALGLKAAARPSARDDRVSCIQRLLKPSKFIYPTF